MPRKGASLAQWGCCTDRLFSLCGRPCVGTVFRSGSVWLGTCLVWILHFWPPFPPAPFFRHGIIVWENEKSRPPWNRRTAWNRGLTASALFQNKKAGILEASAPQKSRLFWNDNFLKTLQTSSALFEFSEEIKKGTTPILLKLGLCVAKLGWYLFITKKYLWNPQKSCLTFYPSFWNNFIT